MLAKFSVVEMIRIVSLEKENFCYVHVLQEVGT